MPAADVAIQIKSALHELQKTNLKDPSLGEVLDLAQRLTDAMQAFFGSLDRSVYSELRYIAQYIQRTRDEISELRPNDIREARIPSAGAELEAIVKHTEDATNTIMACAEKILSCDPNKPEEYTEAVQAHTMLIFEACSFQDITGQRVRKVVDTLKHIESRVGRFAQVMGVNDAPPPETPEEKLKRDLLLNGPALGGPETAQDDIDALFASGGGPASQDDIDALFN